MTVFAHARFSHWLLILATIPPSTPALAGWDEGVIAFKTENYAQAIREFRAAIESQPEQPASYFMLGQSLMAIDHFEEALSPLQTAQELDSSNNSTQLLLGQALNRTRRHQEAVEVLATIDNKLLKSKQQVMLFRHLSDSLFETGQVSSAFEALESAVTLEPDDPTLHYQYGRRLLKHDRFAEAVDALNKSVGLKPGEGNLRALNDAAIRLGRQLDEESAKSEAYLRAVNAASELLDLDPRAENLFRLGVTQLSAGQYFGAAQNLQLAAIDQPGNWLALYHLGNAEIAINELASAAVHLQQALERDPDAAFVIRIWDSLGVILETQKQWPLARSAYQESGNTKAIARVDKNEIIEDQNQLTAEKARVIQELNTQLRELEAERQRVKSDG